jgi:predicted RecA/RadA family phage recombinase
MIAEAVSALQETHNALVAIDRNQRSQALEALARATGKLEILLAREPRLALAPIDVTVVTRDVVGDQRTLERLRKRAEDALEKGRLQEARRLISDLASESVLRVSNLPLATYPAALKSAAAQLERNQSEVAKTTLQAALSTVVVEETIFPLPLHRAEVALSEGKRLAEKANRTQADNRRLALLLASARQQIKFGQALGYGTEQEMGQLLAEVDQIESRTTGQRSGRGFFDRIGGLFDKARQSSQSQRSEG